MCVGVREYLPYPKTKKTKEKKNIFARACIEPESGLGPKKYFQVQDKVSGLAKRPSGQLSPLIALSGMCSPFFPSLIEEGHLKLYN